MKKNQLTFVLVGVFFLSTLGTVVLMVKYRSSVHALQDLRTVEQNGRFAGQILVQMDADANEYNKAHPELKKFFQQNTPTPASALAPK